MHTHGTSDTEAGDSQARLSGHNLPHRQLWQQQQQQQQHLSAGPSRGGDTPSAVGPPRTSPQSRFSTTTIRYVVRSPSSTPVASSCLGRAALATPAELPQHHGARRSKSRRASTRVATSADPDQCWPLCTGPYWPVPAAKQHSLQNRRGMGASSSRGCMTQRTSSTHRRPA